MLIWNWLTAWFLVIFALVGYSPSFFQRRCPRCGESMQAQGGLDLLAQWADQYWGWSTFRCEHCSYQQTALAMSRDPRVVIYQTHIVR